MKCQAVNIYQYFPRGRRIVDLNDGTENRDMAGGVAYIAAVKNRPIFVAHVIGRQFNLADVDRKFANCSILARSFGHEGRSYVFVLRSKWLQPSFLPEDLTTLESIGRVLAQCLFLADKVQSKINEGAALARLADVERSACDALDRWVIDSAARWDIVNDTAHKLYGTDRCLVAVYEGGVMHYLSTNVRAKFDECIVGKAFNYRELMWDRSGEESELKCEELYRQLGVEIKKSVAFHIAVDGKVRAAIELINPDRENIDDQARQILTSLASLFLQSSSEGT
jgi:hypothetical protein